MNPELIDLVNHYDAPAEVADEMRPIETVLLTGIAAAGKDTTENHIASLSPDFVRFITSTTREPRENNGVMEVDGIDYVFQTLDRAKQRLVAGEYVEAAVVHGDRINGSLVSEFRRIAGMGKIALGDVDYQGVKKYLALGMDNLSVYFVVPPSFEIWLARWIKREGGSFENRSDTLKRFESAQKELTNAENNNDFIPIINDDSVETAQRIIYYTETGIRPTEEEREQVYTVIRHLNQSITDYVTQLQD